MGEKEKIVMVGDYATGKTCMLLRLTQNFFNSEHNQTIGAAFIKHTITLPNGQRKDISLWDTSGDERFRSVMPVYFRGASSAIIVFDVTSRESFESLQYWINLAKESGSPNINIVIAGAKSDLSKNVSEEEALQFGRDVGYPVIFCSAYSGANIQEVFQKAAETSHVVNNDDDGGIDVVGLADAGKKEKDGCC